MRTPQKYFGVDADFTSHAGVGLGNILTQASVGLTVRSDGLSWYVFFGAEGRGVLRNIFLDGNTFRNSYSVDKKPFVGDVQGGIAVVMGRSRLAYTHILWIEKFDTQDDTDHFGSISLSFIF
jgi:lipid A 3-O-deacylase